MARFDIYPNPIAEDCGDFPYVLEIQSDLLYQFSERVCVPLAWPDAFPGMTGRLNPPLTVQGNTVHVHPFGIAVFHAAELRNAVSNAKPEALSIETAVDMLLRGY